MKTKCRYWWIVATLVCPLAPAFAEPPAASQPSGVAMGSPYVDLFHGFGITPPAGTERSTDRILAQLVSWQLRDAKTNAVLWTLTVGKIVNKEAPDDMDAYAKSLAATLKEKENFQVASSEVREIAGHKAIDLRGTTEGKMRWWQRQVQIASDKGNFVLLRMTGPTDAADSMDATMTAVLATVKIIDPKEALAQREKNLKAGAEFLKTVTPEKLKAAIQTEPLYTLMSYKGRSDWGECAIQSLAKDHTKGFELRYDIFLVIHSEEMIHSIHKLSASADRASGTDNQKKQSQTFDYQFIQSDWKISDEKAPTTVGSMPKILTKTVPPEIRDCYLPPAFWEILPQLLDLKKHATYGFAVYNYRLNAFDVYTVTVVGSAKIQIGGKGISAYQIDIQPAEDAPCQQEYVDEKGNLLKLVFWTDLVMDAVDKETFLKAFPKAAEMIGKD